MLTIEALTIRYGDRVALDRIDLEVDDHEIVCVLGPSGSGKSTLLRAIAGLESPDTGRILRDGSDLAGVPTHRRGLGLMFQDHSLFPHRDVIGNVGFGIRMHGASRSEARARARETLGLVGLAGFESRSVTELSGGEQQRVALARALAPAPSLLMLDEPLGALDRSLREHLVDELRTLFRDLGLAVLLVTHDHDEAFALGDRVAILDAGRIEQVGSPVELWTRPATAFVAEFLGWNVTRAFGPGLAAVRPDALRLATGPDSGGAVPTIRARVTRQTFRRDHWRIQVEAADGSALDLELRDARPPTLGSMVEVTVDPADVIALPDRDGPPDTTETG
jgi:thiamine transport system ATP-binding protein